jgi:hypothetical protein
MNNLSGLNTMKYVHLSESCFIHRSFVYFVESYDIYSKGGESRVLLPF